jgi:hypothetical protein
MRILVYSPEEDLTVVAIPLPETPLDRLVEHCAEETARFFKRVLSDTRYCLEIFRRALVEREDAAWSALYTQYRDIVRRWLQRHPQIGLTGESAEDLVNPVFAKLWSAITAEKFAHFDDLPRLMHYFKMCVHSVVIDCTRRAHYDEIAQPAETRDDAAHAEVEEHDPQQISAEDEAFRTIRARELWQRIQALLHDEQEELIVYASFVLDETPREIYAHYPDRFGSVQEIYSIKRNIVKRLERNLNPGD